jgi:hypothetical protein
MSADRGSGKYGEPGTSRHLETRREGWNEWRVSHFGVAPDLIEADLLGRTSTRRTREKAAGLASLCIMLVGFGTKKMARIRALAIEKGV